MQKWSYFSMGIMAGIIAVLLTVVVMQNREPQAHAQAATVDGGGGGLIMGVGGSTTQQSDLVWVLNKHAAPKGKAAGGGEGGIVSSKDEYLTLACYQVSNQARSVRLVATRNITFDLDLVEYHNEKPSVKDIVEELKKAQPKDEKTK
jgi:hypothetical protein